MGEIYTKTLLSSNKNISWPANVADIYANA
jgi:hypothetical protein